MTLLNVIHNNVIYTVNKYILYIIPVGLLSQLQYHGDLKQHIHRVLKVKRGLPESITFALRYIRNT